MIPGLGHLTRSWAWGLGSLATIAVIAVVVVLVLSDGGDGAEPQSVGSTPAVGDPSTTDVSSADDASSVDTSSVDEAAAAGDESQSVDSEAAGGAESQSSVSAVGSTSDDSSVGSETAGEAEAADTPDPPAVDGDGDEPELQTDPPGEAPEPLAEPELRVEPAQIRQGETVLVRLSGVEVGSAWVTVDGSTTVMVDEAGVWVGFVPVQPLSDLGAYTVIVDLFDEQGDYAETLLGEFSVVDARVPIESITLIPGDEGLLAPALVAQDNTVRFVENAGISSPRAWSEPWLSPLAGPATGIFGALRSYNGAPASDWHHGHDISAAAGTSITAPAPGTVVFSGELPVHGLGVILDHGAGVFSGYWHMSAIAADLGAVVAAGEVLGSVGESGLAVGPHLHWELIVHGRDVDPVQWLSVAFHG